MFRGFIAGIFWGVIAVVGMVAMASLIAPLPATVVPQTSAVESTTGSDKQDSGTLPTPSQADEAIDTAAQNPVDAVPSENESAPLADTASAPQPEVPEAQETLTAPKMGEADSGMARGADDETPVLTPPQSNAPVEPQTDPEATPEEDLSITTNPDQPATPDVPKVGSAFETPEGEAEADLSPGAEARESDEVDPEPVMKPAGTLTEKPSQHKSERLPSVGSADGAAAKPATSGAFVKNAESFDAEPGKPLMSIVLIDDGSAPVDAGMLSSFPYPLSFAISTLLPDAAEREAAYRKLGFETLAMIDIPAAAAASDVEVAMEAHLAVMPGAVAVIEGAGEGLQGGRELSDQVTAHLLASGHGLVMFAKGLNTAQKLASREGVPAATVFRDFDSKGQSASVIRRFLDQAAFKADREGGVIMVGRVREETISALMVWGLQDRARSVGLAPVSAVLRGKM